MKDYSNNRRLGTSKGGQHTRGSHDAPNGEFDAGGTWKEDYCTGRE